MDRLTDTWPLSPRQREVLALLARNWSEKHIARELGLSTAGVKAVVSRLRKRLHVPDGASMIAAALMYELVGRVDLEPWRLAPLFARAPLGVLLFSGPRHVLELMNDEAARWLGREISVGQSAGDVLTQPDAQPYLRGLDEVYESGARQTSHDMHVRWRHDGLTEDRYIDLVMDPVRGPSGLVEGVAAFVVDITACVRAMQRSGGLDADEFAYLHHVAEGALIYDLEGKLVFANESAHRILGPRALDPGLSLGEVLDSHRFGNADQGGTINLSASTVLQARAEGDAVQRAGVVRRTDTGAEIAVRGWSVPIRARDGRPRGTATIFSVVAR